MVTVPGAHRATRWAIRNSRPDLPTVGGMTRKKAWGDLSPTQRKVVVAGAAAELAVTTWALRDLRGRPADGVRGPKALWVASFAVQPFGPLAYFAVGRRRP